MPTFFSPNALESMRASGYKNTQYALAELVDNSFDAEANTVKIIFFEKKTNNRKYIDEIIVCDDGTGMKDDQLQVCLQFGFTGNSDLDEIVKRRKKGKFGFGLPNASISQCPNVHVFSRHGSGHYKTTSLSLQHIKDQNTIEIPDIHEVDLPAHYIDAGAMLDDEKGTIVAWRDCDRLSNTRAQKIIEKSERLLGEIYRYLLASGKQIVLEAWEYNSKQHTFNRSSTLSVVPNDPLFLMSNTYIARLLHKEANEQSGIQDAKRDPATYYKKFSISDRECKPTNIELPDHSYLDKFEWRGKAYEFRIRTSYAALDIQKPGIREGGKTKVGQFYGEKSSISFVRADREICSGNFGFYRETEPRNRWWTIEVQFSADADDLLGVSNNKQGIGFWATTHPDAAERFDPYVATLQQAREQFWVLLTKRIDSARHDVFRTNVLKQHKEWDLANAPESSAGGGGNIPGATDETIQASRKTDGKRESQFLPQQKESLVQRLQEKYPAVTEQEIEQAVQNFDELRVKGCILYCPSEASALWTITSVFGFLVILINTEHEFYKRILHPFRNHKFKAPLAAQELFISSLAWEEFNHFNDNEDQRNTLETFRTYTGLHLNRYLLENNIEVSESDLKPIDDLAEAEA